MSIAHCLCGAVRIGFDRTRIDRPDICHCESCRRASGAPMVAWFAVPDTAWRWTGALPREFGSSPGVTRFFCGTCGTHMGYRTVDLPNELHIPIATLADPENMAPQRQAFADERLSWIDGALTLPRD